MYCGEISKRELYEKFRTRSQKQILSKLNKRKYLYEKEYGLFVSKEKLESFTTSLHTLKRLGVNEHKSYVDLYDDQRGKTIRIEKVFLTDLIKANLNKDSTTLRIDEKIIKTLLMAKSCILAMKSLVEEEKKYL